MKQVLLLLCSIRKLFSLKEGPQLPRDRIKTPPSWDEILTWLLSDVRWTSQCPSLPISGSGSDSGLATGILQGSCCNTQTYLLLTLKMDYMQGSVGCSSDSPPNTDILKFWAKKQAASTTINLTDSFKLQYTLLHAGTCGRSEWHRVTSCRMTISRRYICTLNEMNRIRSPFYTVVPSGSRSK